MTIKKTLLYIAPLLALVLTMSRVVRAEESTPKAGVLIATDFPSLHEAVAAARKSGEELYLPAGNYVLTKTLDLTLPTGALP